MGKETDTAMIARRPFYLKGNAAFSPTSALITRTAPLVASVGNPGSEPLVDAVTTPRVPVQVGSRLS